MACYHPSKLDVERQLLGDVRPRFDTVTVPCGKCLGCRSDQGREWAIRLKHEADLHPASSWFVTLTYAPEFVPGNAPEDYRSRGSLDPDDVRDFLKRLRHKSRNKIGYYLCGEYGETTDRPHYHMALFGLELRDKEEFQVRSGIPIFTSPILEETWGKGFVEFSALSWKSASYVAGYVIKKAREKVDPTKHLRVDPDTGEIVELEQEFARMSRRPALGRRWIDKFWRDVYPRDFVVMNGSPVKPPRYYDKQLERIAPEVLEQVKYQRWLDAEEIGDDQLIMKEKVHRSRLKLFSSRGKI